MLIRPVTKKDHKALLALAKKAGIGMTSLPPDEQVLTDKIETAERSFGKRPEHPQGSNFLFVLEDTSKGKIVGSVGIKAHIGLRSPFYSYKVSTVTQASKDLEVYSMQQVLHMVNDYTGATEIGSLYLLPSYRKDGLGAFLSRSRYLMLAEFPEIFSDTVIAEMRGVHDQKGESPFYNNLARHFFQMPFPEADYINATKGGQFISDLMPRYPVYVTLLTKKAQSVIGVPYSSSKKAMHMLEREGFYNAGYVDIFDAGPTLEVKTKNIQTVKQSKRAKIASINRKIDGDEIYMISHTRLKDFSIMRAPLLELDDGQVIIDRDTAEKLKLKTGQKVRYAR